MFEKFLDTMNTSHLSHYAINFSLKYLLVYFYFLQVEVEGGGFHCRVILPDDKKSEADVILWYRREPTRTSMEAQHRASVMALYHIMGNRRYVPFQTKYPLQLCVS